MTAYVTYTDDALLTLWKQNKELAFECFYKRHFLKLVNTAVHKVYDWQLAEELAQDAFMALYKNSNGVENNPVAYCYRVLKNKIADHYRKHRLEAGPHPSEDYIEPTIDDPKPAIEYKELEGQVREHIAALPEQCRRVFLLRRDGNLSNQEVAERLGISIKTVEAHMTKAVTILKKKLEYTVYAGILIGLELLKNIISSRIN